MAEGGVAALGSELSEDTGGGDESEGTSSYRKDSGF